METASNTPSAVSFVKGAALSAPVTSTRSSKYDALLEDVLVEMLAAPASEWRTWTLGDLKTAERSALQVRTMGKTEGGGQYHFKARAQEGEEGAGILFVQKLTGPAPTRPKKSAEGATN